MQGRFYHVLGVVFLITLLMFTVSCDQSPSDSGTTGSGTTSADFLVANVTLNQDQYTINNFLGKTDTVTVTARAIDAAGVGVAGAQVDFTILNNGLGAIVKQDTATNAFGEISAFYIVTLDREDPPDVQIEARVVNAGKSDQATIRLITKEVTLSLAANPAEFRVASGGAASTTLTVTVSDISGVGVNGVPVTIRKISGPDDALLTPIYNTGTDGSAVSTLSISQVSQTAEIEVVAEINVYAGDSKAPPTKGLGALRDRLASWMKPGNNESEMDDLGGGSRQTMSSVVSDTITVIVTPLEGAIDSVYVWVTPDKLNLPPDSSGVATVYAVAFDEERNGITNLQFSFAIEDTNTTDPQPTGVISQPQPTDSTGTATATIRTNRQFGTWWVIVNAGPDKEYRALLNVEESLSQGGSLELSVVNPVIYADNGITTSQITAILKDQNQIAIAGDSVNFAAIGTGFIEGTVVTDAFGQATAVFTDAGVEGTTQIQVTYNRGSLHLLETTEITILPNRAITELLLQTPNGTVYSVSDLDSFIVRCVPRYSNGEIAEDGTPIQFHSTNNDITFIYPEVLVQNGSAVSYALPGRSAGVDSIYASAGTGDEVVESLHIPIQVLPGNPTRIRDLDVVNQDGSREFFTNQSLPAIVSCTVVDTFWNPVLQGFGVTFSTNIGTITPSDQTDDNGFVQAEFSPGTQAGQARIVVTAGMTVADSVDITIQSGTPQSIALNADKLGIAVAGTGGQETATVTATVTDPNGNPVQDQTKVFFLLDQFPIDPSPDGQNPRINDSDGSEPNNPFGLPFDSSLTNGGMAMVSVNSGTMTGPLRLRAWAFKDEDLRGTPDADSVWTIFTELAVIAGPPASVEIDVNEIGEDGGGAIWNVEVSARVADMRNNPVADSIVVQFEVIPDIATIGTGYTGNEDAGGTISPGVANTIMSYHSSVTNDSVNIEASVLSETGEAITGTLEDFNLPIQLPEGVLYADPRNWDFGSQPDPATFHMTVFVYDGHDVPINDQLVRFLTTRGRYYTAAAGGTARNEAYTGPLEYPTGVDNDNTGWANRYLRIAFTEAFPDPNILETTASAEVEIIGYPDAAVEPVTLNMQHPAQ